MSEIKIASMIQLAREASGVNAYQYTQSRIDRETPSANPFLRTLTGGTMVFAEFIHPVTMRVLREEKYGVFPDMANRLSIVTREFTSLCIPLGLAGIVAINTGRWDLSIASFLISKFILNGVVNLEMDKIHSR